MVSRQPSRLSVTPRIAIVRISATCPMLMIGMIQLVAMPTCGLPRNMPAQLKYAFNTKASTKRHNPQHQHKRLGATAAASTQANLSSATAAFFGGVCGNGQAEAASTSEATPAMR